MITVRPAVLLLAGAGVLGVAGALSSAPNGVDSVGWPWWGGFALLVVVAAVTAVDIALAAPASAVRLARSGGRAVWLGESTSVRLTVHNPTGRTLRATVRDAWVPSAGATPQTHDLLVPAGAAAAVDTALTPTRRGDRAAVRVVVRSYGPLRMGYRQTSRAQSAALTPPWKLRVYPRFAARRFLPEKLARLRVLDGATAVRGRGQGTEFDSLREYVVGDDVRSIDWRASARRNDVLVRTWRPERDRRVLCVLDTGRTSAARIGDEPRLDASIDAALLLATLAARAGDQVDLLAIDTAVRAGVTGTGRRSLLQDLVNSLAPLAPALAETDFGLVTSEVLRRTRKRALLVLFTALEPGTIGEGLLPVLPALATRHTVVVAAVHDPELHRLADAAGAPTRVEDVYTAAAAARTLAERERVTAALRRYNVEVVDAPAATFAAEVADIYLALKARGKL